MGQSSEGQMWRFLVNKNGSYRIMSQLSDCRKCITVKNNALYSCTYNDSGINNEWELEQVSSDSNNKKVCLIAGRDALKDSVYNRPGILPIVAGYYRSQNSSAEVLTVNSFNGDSMLNAMKKYNIVSISTHGNTQALAGYDSSGKSTEGLTSGNINNRCKDGELSNLKICLLSGCYTAKGKGSITETVYNKGAQCAVGFTDEIYIPNAIEWDKAFNEMIAKGGNVELAFSYADR